MAHPESILNYKELFVQYFIDNHYEEILDIIKAPDQASSYSVYLDLIDLLASVVEISKKFLLNSYHYLNLLQESLLEAQKRVFNEHYSETNCNLSIKNKITARLVSLPYCDEVYVNYPDGRHVNKLVRFNGTVTKAFGPRIMESTQTFMCNKCGHEITVKIDFGHVDLFLKPVKCSNDDCNSDKFKVVSNEKNFKSISKDYQEIKVQEKKEVFSNNTVPKSMIVILEDDLVDCCKPGDDVTINAVVIQKWNRTSDGLRPNIEIMLHANYIKVNNDEQYQINMTPEKKRAFENFWRTYKTRPLTGRNIILNSLCPQLYGMYVVKLAVCLVLTGGVSRQDPNGTRVRGESHLLLVGDPGTGKSQFLRYAQKLIPRSVMTTGIGSSSAGLTATASRDGGMWHLEAGALVLADGGICCVDEFNCMKDSEKTSILEAMEQQTISVAKAGIVCKLKTQCSVLAACNPKGKYDSSQPITVNLAMPSPLLSRFDLVLLLLDTPNLKWDTLASTYLLQGKDLLKKAGPRDNRIWPFNDMRTYINYVKGLEPMLTPEANVVIQRYYQLQRKSDDRNVARTTVRLLESIIRLSQAHAKLMMRDTVLVMDAVVAITLIECSLNKSASFGDVNILHTSFPDNPELEYQDQIQIILDKLDCVEIYEKELHYINSNFEPFMNSCQDEQPNTSDNISQMVNNLSNQSVLNSNRATSSQTDRVPSSTSSETSSKRKLNESVLCDTTNSPNDSSQHIKKFKSSSDRSENRSQVKSTLFNSQSIKIASSTQKASQTLKQLSETINVDSIDVDELSNFDI